MPIRFSCEVCRTPLAVATRKAGAEVNCPKCQAKIVVPAATAAVGAPAMGPSIEPPDAPPIPGEPGSEEPDWSKIVEAVEIPRSAIVSAGMRAPVEVEVDRDQISIPRRLIYVQAGVFAGALLFVFVIGYLVGRGVGPAGADAGAGAEPVVVHVRVDYEQGAGKKVPDAGAAVIVLPAGKPPKKKMAIPGLNPAQPSLTATETIKALEGLGGAYARGDNQGIAELLLKPGKYHVLVLSNNALRPGGAQPKPKDIATLASYFESAADLFGDKKYDFSLRRFPKEAPLDVNMGISGR